MWDKVLTDQDGPYLELMAGAYSPTTSPTTVGSSPTRPRSSSSTGIRSASWAGSRTPTCEAAVNLEILLGGRQELPSPVRGRGAGVRAAWR